MHNLSGCIEICKSHRTYSLSFSLSLSLSLSYFAEISLNFSILKEIRKMILLSIKELCEYGRKYKIFYFLLILNNKEIGKRKVYIVSF